MPEGEKKDKVTPLKLPNKAAREAKKEQRAKLARYFQGLLVDYFEETPTDVLQRLIDDGFLSEATDSNDPTVQFENIETQRALADTVKTIQAHPETGIRVQLQAHAGMIEPDKRVIVLKGSIEHDDRRIILTSLVNKGTQEPQRIIGMTFQ